MDKKDKIELIERLIKEDKISLQQGLILLETEKEIVKEYVYIPYTYWTTVSDKTIKDPYPMFPPYNPTGVYTGFNPKDVYIGDPLPGYIPTNICDVTSSNSSYITNMILNGVTKVSNTITLKKPENFTLTNLCQN